jgi:hypothetical protein
MRPPKLRRQFGLNAPEHFDGRCEAVGGLGRGNDEGENLQPAREGPGGFGAILDHGGALDEPARDLEYRSLSLYPPSSFEAHFGNIVGEGDVFRENGNMRQKR